LKNKLCKKPARKQAASFNKDGCFDMASVQSFPLVFLLVSCLAYSSTMKVGAICSSEMSVDFQRATWHYVAEGKYSS
jgi:hypothetical protein